MSSKKPHCDSVVGQHSTRTTQTANEAKTTTLLEDLRDKSPAEIFDIAVYLFQRSRGQVFPAPILANNSSTSALLSHHDPISLLTPIITIHFPTPTSLLQHSWRTLYFIKDDKSLLIPHRNTLLDFLAGFVTDDDLFAFIYALMYMTPRGGPMQMEMPALEIVWRCWEESAGGVEVYVAWVRGRGGRGRVWTEE